MSDFECVLLTWAVVATLLALEYRGREKLARDMFMKFVRDKKARDKVVADWEAFKKANNVREGT